MRWAKTISGGASISMEVENSATGARVRVGCECAALGFGGLLQGLQMARPEAVEELLDDPQAVGAHAVEMPRALALLADQPGGVEHAQVKGDRLLRHANV